MAGEKRVVLDAGHGGTRDPGAVFWGRQEKDDTLRLALAVGRILEDHGIEVVYTRIDDVYDSPYEKAQMANEAEADYFVSIHRNASDEPGSASGVLTLVYRDEGVPGRMARAINQEMEQVGFTDLGVAERPNLVVLRRVAMPAVLVEAGFIDNPNDNRLFDENFDEIANAIATGILNTIGGVESEKTYYAIQTGAYGVRSRAEEEVVRLQSEGFPAYLVAEDDLFHVRVGAYTNLENATNMEAALRKAGYSTFMVQI